MLKLLAYNCLESFGRVYGDLRSKTSEMRRKEMIGEITRPVATAATSTP